MIIGGHSIIYSKKPEADRAFLRDVLALPHVDVGDGWLIFGLPPAEIAVHPSDQNDLHEFYFMCDDVRAFAAEMARRNIACDRVIDQGYGLFTQVRLPGGGKLGVYEPRHARPNFVQLVPPAKRPAKRAASKSSRPGARKSPRKPARRR